MQSKRKIPLNNVPVYEISGEYTARGCEAFFYRMGKSKYGIKIYKSFQLAFESYQRQILAAKHNLGPKVGKFLMVKKKNQKKIHFGYETQKLEEIDLKNPKHLKIIDSQSDTLRRKLGKYGLAGDFDSRNCGILNGKLMSVDFGSHSTLEW